MFLAAGFESEDGPALQAGEVDIESFRPAGHAAHRARTKRPSRYLGERGDGYQVI